LSSTVMLAEVLAVMQAEVLAVMQAELLAVPLANRQCSTKYWQQTTDSR